MAGMGHTPEGAHANARAKSAAALSAADKDSGLDDRPRAVSWARGLLEGESFCILDSETTGLSKPRDFVEVAVVGPEGEVLFDSLVRPMCRIEPRAKKVHGRTGESLRHAPPFAQIYPELLEVLRDRGVVVYNAPYDRGVWDEAVYRLGVRGSLAKLPEWECDMRWYAAFVGEVDKRGRYRWQKLSGGDHTALGDARATLEALEEIAYSDLPRGARPAT